MSSDAQPQQRYIPPSRRRDKPILSCSLCRRRKLKCDRQQPCKTCVDRGLSLSCTYTRHPSTLATAADPRAAGNVHDRIDQLEKLVTTLMAAKRKDAQSADGQSNPSIFSPPALSYSPKLSDGAGNGDIPIAGLPDRVELDDDETRYTNSGHWTSILDGIAELKDALDQIPTTPEGQGPADDRPGPDLLFGNRKRVTRQEILAGVPPKSEADQMVVRYYAFMDMAPTLLHRPTFLREYERFWDNPSETPVMWLGTLFTLFAVATRFQSITENWESHATDPSESPLYAAKMDFYREKVVQCLILANYTKCPPYTMETFMGYFIIEYLRSRDSQFGISLLVGMMVRLAFRMGYHRDPSRFPNISPFKAEMRRRIWTMVVQLDLMSSMQLGLPRLIQSGMSDVQEPRNLTEDDLDENMTELPPSRPDTDPTAMLYTLVRNRGLHLFARITDFANSSEQPSYQEILELDAAIETSHKNVPAHLKGTRPDHFEPESDTEMRKLFLNFTFLKAKLMLHRPYLLLGRTDPNYDYSRVACLEAALELLDYQKMFERESGPGGKLTLKAKTWSSSWRLSSLVNHDFLLATTILSLYLDKDITSPMPEPASDTPNARFKSGRATRAEIVEALTDAYPIWVKASEKSKEAATVSAAVKLVLNKAEASEIQAKATLSSSHPDDVTFPAQQNASDTAMDITDEYGFLDQLSLPFPLNDIPINFGSMVPWGGLESDYAMPPLEQTLQNAYFGDYVG